MNPAPMVRAVPLLLAVCAPLAGAAAPTPAPSAPSVAATVDRIAREALSAQHIPGMAVAVAVKGTLVYAQGYGVANVASGTAVTPDTRFEIGSITKQFTAAAILQLVQAKRLSLDARLGKFVPQYAAGAQVTVRQLMLQTSGIPDYFGDDASAASAAAPATLTDILARIAGKPLEFAPGSRWKYSNTNYWLLGFIVASVSKQTYEDYVRANLFSPAGMVQSGFVSDEAQLPNMATGYTLQHGNPVPSGPLAESFAGGAGEIVSTALDVVRWDRALASGKIVTSADYTAMRSSSTTSEGKDTHYGYGWVVESLADHPYIWHNGGTLGFHSMNATFPADDTVVVVLSNLIDARPEAVASSIFVGLHPELAGNLTVPVAGENSAVTARVREWLHRFQTGDIDRSQLTADMNAALTPELVAASKAQLAPLGDPQTLVFRGSQQNGDFTVYTYAAKFAQTTFSITIALDAAGKIGGYRLLPVG